jgi:hypothetical protein
MSNFDQDKDKPSAAALPKDGQGSERPLIGDRAGEHQYMNRGSYNAWAHVVIGFIYVLALYFSIFLGIVMAIQNPAAGQKLTDGMVISLAVCGALALALSIATFWNRWRVNEAFSSRFCSGCANLSIIYVPFISGIYALVRGIKKFWGK